MKIRLYEKGHFSLLLYILYTVYFFIISCVNIGDQITGITNSNNEVQGLVQKGPFISGSSITIQELDLSLNSTGTVHMIDTDDNIGSFVIGNQVQSSLVEIIATGFYYNEVTNELSDAAVTLKAVADISSGDIANVNVLTTLQADRLKYLREYDGLSIMDAMQQSKDEIMAVFNISDYVGSGFSEMDISSAGEGNAILLATSLILQGNNAAAGLSGLIADISLDIKEDGTLDNQSIIDGIKSNADAIATLSVTIRNNLIERYDETGGYLNIPEFEQYVNRNSSR